MTEIAVSRRRASETVARAPEAPDADRESASWPRKLPMNSIAPVRGGVPMISSQATTKPTTEDVRPRISPASSQPECGPRLAQCVN